MGHVYAGTSGWAYPKWKPGFYPAALPSRHFLEYYATRLNSVEVNYTFLRPVTDELLAEWIAATPAEFRFAVKAPQLITHIQRLRDAGSLARDFMNSLEPLRKARKLGPVLFQLPPNMKSDLPRLQEFLQQLPKGERLAFEFRHLSWFSEAVHAALREQGAALCLAESEKIETPDVQTAAFRYLRLRKSKYSATEVARHAHSLTHEGDVFVYFKHEDTPEGALNAEVVRKLAAKRRPQTEFSSVAAAKSRRVFPR